MIGFSNMRLLVVVMSVLACCWTVPTGLFGQSPFLSAEGEARRAAHEYLFGPFSAGKKLTFKGDAPARVLDEIVISSQRQALSGDVLLTLPKGSARVAGMFRYVVLRGEGLDNLDGLVMLPYAPNSNLAISTQTPAIYRVKVAAMPIPSASMPPIQIRTKCRPGTTATITEVAFNSQGKLSTTFDDIPYRNLGAEFARERVDLRIDLDHELSLDGHVDLEREKFCRYYAAPGNLDPSFEWWAAERNFLPGRQIMKFQPSLVELKSTGQPRLAEQTSRPGAADLTFFDTHDSAVSIARTIPPFRSIKYAMCLNSYPDFMSVKTVGRGTPLIENFSNAAELAAAFVADQVKDGGRTATYWEVKNESTIKSEWDYHWNKKYDAWGLLADFHNRVGDAVHRQSPGTMVGGPSSAWMQLQASDFGLYRNQIRFMDLTKDHLDFYSHHFYEDFGTLGAWERRQGRYTNYLLGRMEAILDMFQAHMRATDNVKPILITECGSLQPGRGPSDYWLRIRSYSAYLNKFMQRPAEIDLVVPFAFLSMPWNPKSGDAAFIPRAGKPGHSRREDCDPTPLAHFFDLWRDFDGRRLPVSFRSQWLDVTAVHRGRRIQLAVTNMGGRRLSLNLSGLAGAVPVTAVIQRRLYYHDGQVHYEDAISHADATDIPVDVEETTILTLELADPLTIKGAIERKSWYAAETALKSDAPHDEGHMISIDDSDTVQSATLMIGVQRDGGLGGALAGTFNGRPFTIRSRWADEFNKLFATVAVAIPAGWVARENRVRIDARAGLTITSVHVVTDSRSSGRSPGGSR